MKILFYQYPPCSTCRKAKKYLINHDISFVDRHIVNETPSFEELKKWTSDFNFDINKVFNTSGTVYKERNLKNQLPTLSDDEKLSLLASNGMLIKRPLLILDTTMIVGFNEARYDSALK